MLEEMISKELLRSESKNSKVASNSLWKKVGVMLPSIVAVFAIFLIVLFRNDVTGYFIAPNDVNYMGSEIVVGLIFVALSLIFFLYFRKEVRK